MEWIFDLIFIDGALWFQDWEYCAPVGQTRYGAACVGDCAQRGKNYWWCFFFLMLITLLVPGGATRIKKKKSGNTAPHLERSLPFKLISPHWTVSWFIWVWCSLQVLDTAFTVNGQDCVGECGTQGEKYWWEWCRLFCSMNAGINFLQRYVFLAPQVLSSNRNSLMGVTHSAQKPHNAI